MIRALALPAILVALASPAPAAADAAQIERGKAVFDSAKPACKACHNEKKNPLDNYGATGTAADVKAWLRTPKAMLDKTGKKGPKPAFGEDKIKDADLEALAAYLMSLKK